MDWQVDYIARRSFKSFTFGGVNFSADGLTWFRRPVNIVADESKLVTRLESVMNPEVIEAAVEVEMDSSSKPS